MPDNTLIPKNNTNYVNISYAYNTLQGDPLRTAFEKVNILIETLDDNKAKALDPIFSGTLLAPNVISPDSGVSELITRKDLNYTLTNNFTLDDAVFTGNRPYWVDTSSGTEESKQLVIAEDIPTILATEKGAADGVAELNSDGVVPKSQQTIKHVLGWALSDETSDLTTGLKVTDRIPFDCKIVDAILSLSSPPTGGTSKVEVDILIGNSNSNTTIFDAGGKISITTGEDSSSGGGANFSIVTPNLNLNDRIEVHITEVGSTDAGAGAKLKLVVEEV